MWYNYVLQSKRDGRWYTGVTNNLRKRLWQHNNGKSTYTNGRGPFALIYCEACHNDDDARAREKYLKSGPGKKFIINRIKRFLSLTGWRERQNVLVTKKNGALVVRDAKTKK